MNTPNKDPQVDAAEPRWHSTYADFDAVLTAWQSATDRLQKTHDALRCEVRRLTDELEFKNRELARKNRLADLGQMAAHVAHEMRNALVPLTLYLSLLRRMQGSSEQTDLLDRMELGLAEAQNTVTDLLQFTTDKGLEIQAVALHSLVEDICGGLSPQLQAQRVTTQLDVPNSVHVRADQGMLRRAILNLVLNAIDVMPAGGDLVVTACAQQDRVEIEVADTGPGMVEVAQGQVFDPFFTTKKDGTGLGLAIVQRIAEAHGGEVDAVNCPEGGAAFTLSIPSDAAKGAA